MPFKRLQLFDLHAINQMSTQSAASTFLATQLPEEMLSSDKKSQTVRERMHEMVQMAGGAGDDRGADTFRVKEYGNADFDHDLDELIKALDKVASGQSCGYRDAHALSRAGQTLSEYQQGLRSHAGYLQDMLNPPPVPNFPDELPEHITPDKILLAGALHEFLEEASRPPREEDRENMINTQIAWIHEGDMLDDMKHICSYICRQLGIQERGRGLTPPGSGS